MSSSVVFRGLIGALVVSILATAATAQPLASLSDRNSTALVNVDTIGQYSWNVDGVEHLSRQWFWYRLGTSGAATPFDGAIRTGFKVSDADLNPGDETLLVEYTVPGKFVLSISYELIGGLVGSEASDISEGFAIDNISGSPLSLQFFQYADLDLGGTAGDDGMTISGGNTVNQTDGSYYSSETIVGAAPNFFEANTVSDSVGKVPAPGETLYKLQNGFTNLNNSAAAAGDVSWGFQWNFNIGTGGSVAFSKDKHVRIPAPGAALLALCGVGLTAVVRRRIA